MERRIRRRQKRLAVRQFLLVWTVLTLILGGVIWAFYLDRARSAQRLVQISERQEVDVAREIVDAELANIRSDLLYLSQQAALENWLASGSAAERAQLAADLLVFTREKRFYDQVRYIDATGRERIRVNWNNGHPAAVPQAALQDKLHRYYFKDSLALGRGQVYMSPFDLNIEHGAIERPLKPTIRFGTPVFDRQGRKRGVFVLNYLGRRLIEHLKQEPAGRQGGLWLLNREGYWLLGPRPEEEWGFMYPGGDQGRFDRRYPDAWARMLQAAKAGQFVDRNGLFTYRKISPSPTVQWVVVSHVSRRALVARTAGLAHSLEALFGVVTLLLAGAVAAIAYYGMQRRVAADLLRANEIRFRGLLESAPDPIVITNREGRIELVNVQAESCFGYSRDELLGRSSDILMPERFREQHREYRQYFHADSASPARREGMDFFGQRKGGSEFPAEISLSPLETPDGMVVISVIRDVTARKQAEQARAEAQARYRDLVNNLPLGIYRNTAGPDGRFLEANPALVAMFEADTAEEFLSLPVSRFYHDPSQRAAFNDKITRQGFVVNEEVELVTLKGREFWGAVSAVMKQDKDGNAYFDGIVEDVSARRAAEQRINELNEDLQARTKALETINRELEAFSYSVSHDLRAPLRAIDGFSRILEDGYADRLDDAGRDRLRRIRRAAQHMGALIDDLLKLSRVTRADLKREDVDLSALADEVFDELRKQDPGRAVEFALQPGMRAPCDKRLVRVVLDNLLGNAWKFTGKSDPARIQMGTESHRGDTVFFVRDNGAGFDMAYADKLFGAFQRLHDADEFPGTGIGLATVQRVVHKHGGRIWGEGAVNQGAVFYFTLEPEAA